MNGHPKVPSATAAISREHHQPAKTAKLDAANQIWRNSGDAARQVLLSTFVPGLFPSRSSSFVLLKKSRSDSEKVPARFALVQQVPDRRATWSSSARASPFFSSNLQIESENDWKWRLKSIAGQLFKYVEAGTGTTAEWKRQGGATRIGKRPRSPPPDLLFGVWASPPYFLALPCSILGAPTSRRKESKVKTLLPGAQDVQ
jgi:hypothetical protein